jgi:putative DNA primase/helicase
MSWVNYDDVMNQLRSAGLIISETLRLDAKIQRWKVEDEGHEKRGWSRLREWQSNSGKTYIVGVYGIWHGNDDGKCKVTFSKQDDDALTDDDRAAIRAAHKEAERKLAEVRKGETKRAAQWAASVWGKCTPCDGHDYLSAKQIKPHGLRILPDSIGDMTLTGLDDSNLYRLKSAAGALVVPMHDAKGVVQGLQFIYAKGHPRRIKIERNKEFWPSGMAMGGTFGLIGSVCRDGILLIAEGYATAASLHEATGQSVAYAFSANNLVKAGKELAKAYPLLHLLFCADDDYLTAGNPGCTASANACGELERSAWVKPIFPTNAAGEDSREGEKLTDFNDLAVMTGTPLVLADQINAKLDEMKWRDALPRVGFTPQGGGDTVNNRQALKSMLTVDEGVERFALVFGGKGTMFDYQEHILVPKNDVLDILPEHGWRDMRSVKKVVRMDEVGFDPACSDKRILCNLWGGWPTVPKQGFCNNLLELLEYLCSDEENYRTVYEWVLKWIAYPIQHPGAKMRTALVFHGPQGTGKNLFFEAVMEIYGEYGRIVDQAAIEDKFNDWASRKLLMIADEVVARQELYHVKNKLKSFVTGEWIRINPKNVAAHDERNHVNLVFLSNESQPLVLEKDDRRYTVIHTPEKLPEEFYKSVGDELNRGGIAALHHYLLNLDLCDFDEHTKPPMTKAKEDLIEVSLDSVQRFLQEWQRDEIDNAPFCPCLGSHLYATYKRWCDHCGERSPRSLPQFIGTIKNLSKWKAGQPVTTYKDEFSTNPISRKMIIPPDELLSSSRYFVPKDGKTQVIWLTNCFFAFSKAGEFEQ